jgi:phosphatidylinositol alpha 1,6-mannosyltransferase
VVAPAVGGPLDLVRDGVTGFLVRPGDPAALAGAVSALAASPRLRAAQGAAGRRDVLSRTWPARCAELVGHYEAVLGGVPPEIATLGLGPAGIGPSAIGPLEVGPVGAGAQA